METIYINVVNAFQNLIGIVVVNLVQDQGLKAEAAMSEQPQMESWSASKAIDGNITQSYQSNSCAITEANKYTSIWWKVWLERRFNIAYLEIYFRSDSKFIRKDNEKRMTNI